MSAEDPAPSRDEPAKSAAAPAAAGGRGAGLRRLPAKVWVIAGAATSLLALLGGGAVWLLGGPPPAKPPRTQAATVAAAARGAGPVPSAPDAIRVAVANGEAALGAGQAPAGVLPVAAEVAASAGAATAPDDGAAPAQGPAAAPTSPPRPASAPEAAGGATTSPTSSAGVGAGEPGPAKSADVASAPAANRLATVAPAPPRVREPLPLERLRRRLDEVLGGRVQVASAEGSELRVVSTAAALPAGPAPRRAAEANEGAPPAAAAVAAGAEPAWHYGDGPGGPRQWGRLRPEFAACAGGKRQSPIDIRDGLALDLESLQFDYRPGAFRVVDNGHTVQVDVAPGNALVAGGRRYALQQFHFHRPSEERIDGRRYDMDVHLVHRDDEGRLAVVAVLLERGEPLPVLQTVWNHLPLDRGEVTTPAVPLDPAELLPADRRYYMYLGSLTTPPCSEGVLWIVLQKPVGVAGRQIDIFARLYPMNARPLQATAGRLIKQSN